MGFNFLGRDFYNAISEKVRVRATERQRHTLRLFASQHPDEFYRLLFLYLGAIAGAIPVFVMKDYWTSLLALRWREWLTKRYVGSYLTDRTFYRINRERVIDNPDQRINSDIGAFTSTALGFVLTLLNSAVDLVSFSGILFGIYKPLFFVLIVYAVGGTAASVALGQKLVGLNFLQEAREADFRFALVRVRENAESVAFYGGEDAEKSLLFSRFDAALSNLRDILLASRNLSFFTSFYRFLISFLPAAVVAPLFFRGEIEFGVINQSSSAFNHILGDVSLVVYQFETLAGFAATIDRIGQFEEELNPRDGDATSSPRIARTRLAVEPGQPLLRVRDLTLAPPGSHAGASDVAGAPAALLRKLSFQVLPGAPLLVVGASGAGKTSLLRAIAGLWRDGQGEVAMVSSLGGGVEGDSGGSGGGGGSSGAINPRDVFFLPQKPYLVLGSLRQQLLYPVWSGEAVTEGCAQSNGATSSATSPPPPTDDALCAALRAVDLGALLDRGGLDGGADWQTALSLGEQQRLAFARLLLARPRLALLDESTSALDVAAEALVYRALHSSHVTFVSVGHRPSLAQFHTHTLRLGLGPDGTQWSMAQSDATTAK